MKTAFTKLTVTLLSIGLLVPVAFFIAPQRAQADSNPGCLVGLSAGLATIAPNLVLSVSSGDSPGAVAGWTTAGANVGSCLYNIVMVPILKQMIRNMLQSMTKQAVSWVNGSNSTGQPSYVQNMPKHLQGLSDNAALSFISKISSGLFKSPFDATISDQLNKKYLEGTSLAGFFQSNQCTLPGTAQDQKSFLTGEFKKGGGIAAWFSLTTKSENNPFQLFDKAKDKLKGNTSEAEKNRRQDLIQAGGILSFCPKDSSSSIGLKGASPQIACTNPDGTPAKAVTPGSAISSFLQANVNSGVGQLVSAQDLDSAIGAVVSALANQVMGPNGLFGSSQSSGSVNTTPASGNSDTTASQAVLGIVDNAIANSTAYEAAWKTIQGGAVSAVASMNDLSDFCTTAAANAGNAWYLTDFIAQAKAQAEQAQGVITNKLNPIIEQAKNAPTAAAATIAFAQKVKAAGTASPVADPIQFNADLAKLATMPPMPSDVLAAKTDATSVGNALANPKESLTVVAGSLMDQFALLKQNAAALKTSVCVAPPPPSYGGGG